MLPDVVKQIKLLVADALADVHTAMPGTIKNVDPSTGRATVLPAGQYKTTDGRAFDYPAISGVPLVFPSGAAQGVSVTYPVKEGDGCLLVIAEQSLDAWLYGGESNTDLKHDLTNAIAIPGLFTAAAPGFKQACDEGALVVVAGGTSLVVSGQGVTIKGNVTITGDLTTSGGTVRLN